MHRYRLYDRSGIEDNVDLTTSYEGSINGNNDDDADDNVFRGVGDRNRSSSFRRRRKGKSFGEENDNEEGKTSSASKGTSESEEIISTDTSEMYRNVLFVKACGIVSVIVLVNISLFVILGVVVAVGYDGILSPSLLAFSFGLRHAVDADHIAAIDNVTRKLISDGKKPLTVGLWFSLGHSTVVVLLCVAIAAGSEYARDNVGEAGNIGSVVGTIVSATVLLIIGTLNMILARRLWKQWCRLRSNDDARMALESSLERDNGPTVTGGVHSHDGGFTYHTHIVEVTETAEVEGMGGFLTRCCPRIFRSVDSAWKMYPIGFLFGLGFDTASEVGLLALAATTSGKEGKDAIPATITLIMPFLFASGMSLLDTLDGILMLWSYSWATLHPERKIAFNLFLTTVSGFVALFVGLVESLGCLVDKLHLHGGFWEPIRVINDHFEIVGFGIIGFFFVSSVIAIGWFKYVVDPRLKSDEEGESTTYKRLSCDENNECMYFPDDDAKEDDEKVDEDTLEIITDRFSAMSSIKLVKYVRANAPADYLIEPESGLLEGRVRDVARKCTHRDLANLCRKIEEEIADRRLRNLILKSARSGF